MTRKQLLIICLIIYLIIIFSVEFAYRNVLYEKSVEYIEKINQEGSLKHFYFFWTIIYMIIVIAAGILITLFVYPINIFFCHLSYLLFSVFIMCIFKSVYTEQRPFWDIFLKMKKEGKTLPKPTECDGEFGNPSGHCVLNMYSFFLWHLFINSHLVNKIERNLIKNLIKFLSLVCTLVCMGFVFYSRIYRQMHSINQTIHGTVIGFAIVFTFCFIFEYNKMSLNDFIMFLDKFKFIIIPILIVLYVISIIFGLTLHNDNEEEYKELLIEICGFSENNMFGKNTAFMSSIIFMIIGGYCGFLYINYKNNKSEEQYIIKLINYWNRGRVFHTILIPLFSFLLPGVLLITWLVIPFSYYITKIIVVLICQFLWGFLAFGPCFCFICEKLKKSEIQAQESLIVDETNNEL